MKKIIILLLLACSFWVNAQKISTEYISELCSQDLVKEFFLKEKMFRLSLNQYSRAALVNVGTQHQIPFSIQKGKDYKISIFLTDIDRKDSLRFEILDKQEKLLYTNSDSMSWFFFEAFKSEDLFLKVSIPGQNLNTEISPGIVRTISETGCLVVLFQEGITLQTGF